MASTVQIAPSTGHGLCFTQLGTGATPGFDAIDLRRSLQVGPQEGVHDALGWKVDEGASATDMDVSVDADVGLATVTGDAITHQSKYVVAPHSANATITIDPSHATLPRIDQVILRVYDSTHDGLGNNFARLERLTGTATAGATTTNRTGAAALPASAIRLCDILVPAASTAVINSRIVDRRPWALGAHARIIKTDGSVTTSATVYTTMAGTVMSIEASGAPMKLTATVRLDIPAGTYLAPVVDGVLPSDVGTSMDLQGFLGGGVSFGATFEWEVVPTAGLRLIGLGYRATAGTGTIYATAALPLIYRVEEIVRPIWPTVASA